MWANKDPVMKIVVVIYVLEVNFLTPNKKIVLVTSSEDFITVANP